MTTDIVAVLNADDEADFERLDAEVIQDARAINNFLLKLGEIRDRRLWRGKHESFKVYLKSVGERIGRSFGVAYGSRLISWVNMQEELGDAVILARESHARELVHLDTPELKIEAFRLAQGAAEIEGKRLAARHIAAAVAVITEREITGGYVDDANGSQVEGGAPVTGSLGAVVANVNERRELSASNNRVGVYQMSYVSGNYPTGKVLFEMIPQYEEQRGTPSAMPTLKKGEEYVMVIYRKVKKVNANGNK